MSSRLRAFVFVGAVLYGLSTVGARGAVRPNDWSLATREAALTRAEAAMSSYYFSDKVAMLRATIEKHRAALLRINDPKTFASDLTSELQAASGDEHIIVWYSPTTDDNTSTQQTKAEAAEQARFFNYVANGYNGSARLQGNIGYLAFGGFADLKYAKKTIDAAMGLLSDTNALIIDLRQNGGGDSDTVNYLLSYFFPGHVELITAIQKTPTRTVVHHNYTAVSVGGARYLDEPVYILIGPKTISGGEEFAYDMKVHKHATVVGARSAGAANGLGSAAQFLTANLRISIPDTILRSPITGTNWEGGVIPNIRTVAKDTLLQAYTDALAAVPTAYDPLGELGDARKDPAKALRDSLPF